MAEISKIEVNNTEYDIKDVTARQELANAIKLFVDDEDYISVDYGGDN